jgi:pimeloyl-ACP methyl ester carboxylesterase
MLGLCSRVDRYVLDRFIRRPPCAPMAGLRERMGRALDFYTTPLLLARPENFFRPPAPIVVRNSKRLPLPGGELVGLDYETKFVPVFPEARNDACEAQSRRGVAVWWRHRQRGHPAVICVHGYGGGQIWLETLAFDAARFYHAGVDVLLYVLPYHGARTPAGARHSGEAFFDMDLVRTNEAFARAIYELRALMQLLRASGTGPVGAFGMSLGGYTVALLASIEPRLAFSVPMIPLVSFADRWWADGDGDAWLAVAMENGWSFESVRAMLRVHEPLTRPALVPHGRRLIIGARGDAICTPEHADALWHHWDRPAIHWYPGGHLVQLRRGAALRDVRALISRVGLETTAAELPAVPQLADGAAL